MIKTVIANSGLADIGKTSSIKEIYYEIERKYPHLIKLRNTLDDGDLNALININGITIGVESQGDPNSRIFGSLQDFVTQNCNIIICACRTKSDTIGAVRDLEKQHQYRLIFAQNPINNSVSARLNIMYASHIVDIIDLIMNNQL